jgi:TetR/AcrR family transcriptional repressor of nem operon
VQDLLDGMRLNRGSLYADFADKRSLFLEALQLYRAEVVQRRLAAVREARSAREGIRGFFESLAGQCRPASGSSGCLATNSVAELAERDAGIAGELAAGLRRIEGVFAEVLQRGVASGELPARLPVQATARYLVGMAQGVNVLGRVIHDPAYLDDVTTTALRALD